MDYLIIFILGFITLPIIAIMAENKNTNLEEVKNERE